LSPLPETLATLSTPLPALRWRCLAFAELTSVELYRALQLRAEVFVVEQACAFQDLDGRDPQALHLLGEIDVEQGEVALLAYARLLPSATAFAEASIGRVVTAPVTRGSGLGHRLMRESIAELHRRWGEQPIRIGAQAHLKTFYRQHGFEPQGDGYIEDGIPHLEMLRR
jgi:ElaA protein